MNVFKRIAEVIAEQTGEDIAKITEETTFDELGVDSLDLVEMVMKLEEELGIELETEGEYASIGEFAKFIESKIKK